MKATTVTAEESKADDETIWMRIYASALAECSSCADPAWHVQAFRLRSVGARTLDCSTGLWDTSGRWANGANVNQWENGYVKWPRGYECQDAIDYALASRPLDSSQPL